MILVIEGPSAVGKTTWCRAHSADGFVEEAGEISKRPIFTPIPLKLRTSGAILISAIGRELYAWNSNPALPSAMGIHFTSISPGHFGKPDYFPARLFEMEASLYRRAFHERRLGFADRVCWQEAPVEELRRRAKSDRHRKRRRHEMYLKLVPWMRAWCKVREQVLPGAFGDWPEHAEDEFSRSSSEPAFRYDIKIFDQMIDRLATAGPQTDSDAISAVGDNFRSLPQ